MTADVDPRASVAEDAKVWHLAQIREHACIGPRTVVGRGAYIGVGVQVGEDTKIQNGALIYEPANIGRGVFVGPGAVLTNDRSPRAITPQGTLKQPTDWEPEGVDVAEGASIGANAVCVGPIRIGEWAMIGAGAVVASNVPAHALVVGVPAQQIGWVGRSGRRLEASPDAAGTLLCRETGERFLEGSGGLEMLDS